MHSLSVHNVRFCSNRACTVIAFRKVVINACPVCETPGDVVETLAIGRKKEKGNG